MALDHRRQPGLTIKQTVAECFGEIQNLIQLGTQHAELPSAGSTLRLAFDVVFILNEYLGLMSDLVRKHGGVVDKYIGDSVMAIYGIATRPETGARQALETAADMMAELDKLNERLSGEVAETLRMGIGIHAGPAILGRIGGGASAGLTALGDTVNIASRLESATKDLETMLAVSDAVTTFAGADPSRLRREEITLRGRTNAITVYAASTAGEVRQALSEHV